MALPEPPIYPDLKGKIVLITGIGQQGDPEMCMWGLRKTPGVPPTTPANKYVLLGGNGAAAAHVFSQNGCKIFGCDLNLASAQHTQKKIQSEGGTMDVMTADVTKKDQCKQLVDACMEKYGRIDVLVNNVGMSQAGGPADMPEDVWDAQMDVNLKSVYLMCHHVLPIMEAQKSGAVVNLGSIAALRYIGKPQIAYNTTKAGVIQFTKATALIYAAKGVRLNTVIPGLIHTPLIVRLKDRTNRCGGLLCPETT
jgi:NAD(P)-dependent dehydrogenase (short-subunit alcohol dehydrogenase family)